VFDAKPHRANRRAAGVGSPRAKEFVGIQLPMPGNRSLHEQETAFDRRAGACGVLRKKSSSSFTVNAEDKSRGGNFVHQNRARSDFPQRECAPNNRGSSKPRACPAVAQNDVVAIRFVAWRFLKIGPARCAKFPVHAQDAVPARNVLLCHVFSPQKASACPAPSDRSSSRRSTP